MFAPSLIVTLIVGGLWVVIYWKAAEIDGQPCWLWAGPSAAIFAGGILPLGMGMYWRYVRCRYSWGWVTMRFSCGRCLRMALEGVSRDRNPEIHPIMVEG